MWPGLSFNSQSKKITINFSQGLEAARHEFVVDTDIPVRL